MTFIHSMIMCHMYITCSFLTVQDWSSFVQYTYVDLLYYKHITEYIIRFVNKIII